MEEFPYRIIFEYGPIKIEVDGDKEFVEKQFLQAKELLEKIFERIPMEQMKGFFEMIEKTLKKSPTEKE
ncbi:MAG: hypothetical protein ABIK90_07220 [candidate division WOR-3 bacterium]